MAMQTRDSDGDIKTEPTDSEHHDPTDSGHDPTDSGQRERPTTFRDRHGLKVLGVIMTMLFALVVAVQVGC